MQLRHHVESSQQRCLQIPIAGEDHQHCCDQSLTWPVAPQLARQELAIGGLLLLHRRRGPPPRIAHARPRRSCGCDIPVPGLVLARIRHTLHPLHIGDLDLFRQSAESANQNPCLQCCRKYLQSLEPDCQRSTEHQSDAEMHPRGQ